jgi:hypothetical protein
LRFGLQNSRDKKTVFPSTHSHYEVLVKLFLANFF